MVGIDVVTRVFVEAIREGRKLGFEKLRGKFKCLQGECNPKSFNVGGFYSGLFYFLKNNHSARFPKLT